MNKQRLHELSGFNKNNITIDLLKESKEDLIRSYDVAIKQAEKGLQIDEGLFTSLGSAFKTITSASGKVSKAVAKRAVELADSVKTLYQDEKSKIELKGMINSFATISTQFEKIEKEAPTLLKKDERVREVLKVFSDALMTIQYDLQARAIPPAKANESLTDNDVKNLVQEFMVNGHVNESKKGLQFLDFLKENTNCEIEINSLDLNDQMINHLVDQSKNKKISWNGNTFDFTGKISIKC